MHITHNHYFGIIEDIRDPKRLGRARVRIHGIHSDKLISTPVEDLPWCLVMLPTTSPGISGLGNSPFLLQGAKVLLLNLDKELQEFIIIGTVPTISTSSNVINDSGFKDPEQIYPIYPESTDINTRVTGRPLQSTSNHVGEFEPFVPRSPSYLSNHCFQTRKGHIKEYDDSDTAPRILEKHSSGTQYEISADGTRVTKIVGDDYKLVIGKDTIEVLGSVNIITNGNCNLNCAGKLDAYVGGDIMLTGKNHALIKIEGILDINTIDDITITSSEKINLYAKDKITIKEIPIGYCTLEPATGSNPYTKTTCIEDGGEWKYIKNTSGILLEAINDIEIVGESNINVTAIKDITVTGENITVNASKDINLNPNTITETPDDYEGKVIITGNLDVSGTINTATTGTLINLNTHIHTHGDPAGDTSEPTT